MGGESYDHASTPPEVRATLPPQQDLGPLPFPPAWVPHPSHTLLKEVCLGENVSTIREATLPRMSSDLTFRVLVRVGASLMHHGYSGATLGHCQYNTLFSFRSDTAMTSPVTC